MVYNSVKAQLNYRTNSRWKEQVDRGTKSAYRAKARLAKRYPHLYERYLKEERALIDLERGPLPGDD